MKTKQIYDERIIAERRKIWSDLAQLLFVVLFVSVIVQQAILKAAVEQYLVELVCVIFSGFYILVGNVRKGIDMVREIHPLKNAFIATSVATIIFGIQNYTSYSEKYAKVTDPKFLFSLVVFFLSMYTMSFVLYALLRRINESKIKKIDAELDEEE